jgi:hypothetical protein
MWSTKHEGTTWTNDEQLYLVYMYGELNYMLDFALYENKYKILEAFAKLQQVMMIGTL